MMLRTQLLYVNREYKKFKGIAITPDNIEELVFPKSQ